MNRIDGCQIWKGFAGIGYFSRYGEIDVTESCRPGGRYTITQDAIWEIDDGNVDDAVKARLTTMLIDQREQGVNWPRVTTELIQEVKMKSALPVYERADRLLRFIAKETETIGTSYDIRKGNPGSYAWSESVDEGEVGYLIDYLLKTTFLESPRDVVTAGLGYYELPAIVMVSVEGYRHIERQRKDDDSVQAFVAMWIHEDINDAYENGIERGIEDAGYKPLRIDKKPDVNKIDDDIIAEIRRSRFLVADFTHGRGGARGGVYFEAGFAYGLGIPVIYTCREDMVDKLHFDTRQYAHIVWDNPETLRSELRSRILARIGEGPGVSTSP